MSNRGAALALFAVFLAFLAAAESPALAVSMDKSSRTKECAAMIGVETIHIAAYQPEISFDKFCDDLPVTGKTVLALDFDAPSLRDSPVEIRIVKEPMTRLAARGDLDPLTEAYLAPRTYPNGTLYFEHDFKESGQFIALITFTQLSGETRMAQFKFSVGQPLHRLAPLIVGGALIAAALLFYWRHTQAKDRNQRPQSGSESHRRKCHSALPDFRTAASQSGCAS
ncbi:hypothetical protein RZS28_15075 [Methylocapsa polymorpha]|uniref:Uncharacterized protein n=1 Tax=Methylocapsa polymorpha TaxID=3080828 RepID=A0ABZ0HPK9_9HYPH|nr:hypothetical protein RZS28_15075 [Methylocapsa sp. RX1]